MSNRANARVSERTSVKWLTAFIDRPAETFELASEFWIAVTGTQRSAPRGEHGQFARLVPPDGDAYLRVQRLATGPARTHLDLHVDDIAAFAEQATALGASIDAVQDDVITLRSPAGLAWCAVRHGHESATPSPVTLDDGTRSRVQQICIDVAPDRYETEYVFWSALTQWTRQAGSRPEYRSLEGAPEMPMRLLFQRLDEAHPGRDVDAHLDIFCSDAHAAAVEHERVGAQVVERFPFWIVMRDPSNEAYCLIQRDPAPS